MSDFSHLSNVNSDPHLIFVVEPENKYRFRYESEGGCHGGLIGKDKQKSKKTFPTVKLLNYNGSKKIIIRVNLCTEKKKEHVLEFKKKKSQKGVSYIEEELKKDNTAMFKNLTIVSKKKDDIFQALMDRRLKILGRNNFKAARETFEKHYSDEVKREAREILNSVILCFDAFEEGSRDVKICPSLYSEPICNQKAAAKGDLRIHRMSKVAGTWRGGEEVILLCDKVQKDIIKILFYEIDDNEQKIWDSYAAFSPADVHYQVAITFKTPKYKENTEKTVFVCLDRKGELSEPREFTFIAEDGPSKKRKKCLPKETLELLSPADSASPEISNAVSPEMFETQVNETNSNSFDLQMVENSQSVLNDFSEELQQFLNECCDDFLLPIENFDFALEDDLVNHTVNLSPFAHRDKIFTDAVKKVPIAEGQMAVEERDTSVSNIKQIFTNESGSDKFSKNQKMALSKYAHLISKRDSLGNTLLHLAVLHNKNIIQVMHLNEMTSSDIINIQNNNKQTVLHIATEKNYSHFIKVLLNNGGNPNIKNSEGNNCYHIACQNNFDNCLRCFLRYSQFSAEFNEFNYQGLPPLHLAIMKNSKHCYYLLRKYMPDTTVLERKNGRSLLHYAVEFHPSFITLILEQEEIDINIQDFEGNTPLHIACAIGNYDVVKQLLLSSANPLVKNFKRSCFNLEEDSSDDQFDDVETNEKSVENTKESCEDETSVGQTPAELTTNSKVLELLRQAAENNRSNIDQSADLSGLEISDTTTKKLCDVLDPVMKWKRVATYFIDEEFLNSLECSSSPTRALLDHIKKVLGTDYMQQFKQALEMAELFDAVEIINESNEPLIVL